MAISYSPIELRGKAAETVYGELLFQNETVGNKLVAFEDDVKADTIFTENSNTVAMQAYTSGAPSSSGTLAMTDTAITPVKVMYYQEFDPNTLRSSRFKRDMKKGAWNIESNEFANTVLDNYNAEISYDAEYKWWNNALGATQTAVAALTPGAGQGAVGAAEQTYVAALTAGQFDGVVTRMIYNGGALGTRVKVAGTTITSSNIATEYAKLYTASPSVVAHNGAEIFAPKSHLQLINIYNTNATYRDLFAKEGGKYYYNGVVINFVPLAENVMIMARPDHMIWATDVVGDINLMKIDKIANNREDMFLKNIFTIFAHVVRQSTNVLYIG